VWEHLLKHCNASVEVTKFATIFSRFLSDLLPSKNSHGQFEFWFHNIYIYMAPAL
jgi:hypothetical protein